MSERSSKRVTYTTKNMYRRSLNPAAREQNTDELNSPGQPSMNPVRERLPTGRHQENSQNRRQENAGISEHRQHMRATYRYEGSTSVLGEM